jgi:hypothetical protein
MRHGFDQKPKTRRQRTMAYSDDPKPRTDADYAIEFGEYMAVAAEHYLDVLDKYRDQVENGREHHIHPDMVSDAWSGLRSAVYEFRKRATRAGHEPSAKNFNR